MKHIIGAGARPVTESEKSGLASTGAQSVPLAQVMVVDDESAGQRLDNFLMRQLKGVPKSHVYRIIRSGEVRLNKGRTSADARLAVGDRVRLPPVRVSIRQGQKQEAMEQASRTVPAREFPMLFEDDAFLALDKPAGVAVHGGSGVTFGVIEQLRIARPDAVLLELVHRLDRETSGVLLVAKKRSALKALQEQFRSRETGKTYLALVAGEWPVRLKVLDKPLLKYLDDQDERRVRVVARDDPQGMKSVTLVRVHRVLQGLPASGQQLPGPFSLLEVTIKTGRTHQIRVHLASEGFPIVGDDKYGDFELNKRLDKLGCKRMFLHAWRLNLNHPKTGLALTLQAPLPPELSQWADLLPNTAGAD